MTGWLGYLLFGVACWLGALAIIVWWLERYARHVERQREKEWERRRRDWERRRRR